MNQILEYDMGKSGKAPKNKKGGSTTSDKIVRVFAIILILFAIALIGSGVYSIVNNSKEQENSLAQEPEVKKAIIEAVADEENKKVLITVKSEIEIDELIYCWNQETERKEDGENNKVMNKTIDLPSGENTLNIRVIDKDGKKTEESFKFESETGIDVTKPNITLELTEDKKLLITATDETEIAYFTYMWNEGEQITVEATQEGQTEIKKIIDIPKEVNTITVIAVDASERSNINSMTKTFTAAEKPEIKYSLNSDGSILEFVCTHEKGIKSIKYEFNGKSYQKVFEDNEISDYVQFTRPSDEGTNNITLVVTSVDDVPAEFTGTWEYFPVVEEETNTIELNSSGTNSDNTTTSDNTTNEIGNNTVGDDTSLSDDE